MMLVLRVGAWQDRQAAVEIGGNVHQSPSLLQGVNERVHASKLCDLHDNPGDLNSR